MKRSYSEQSLKQAIDNISNKVMTLRKASKFYEIPFTTLRRKVKNGDSTYERPGTKPKLGKEIEEAIITRIQMCQNEGQELNRKKVKQFAVEMDNERPPEERVFNTNGPSSMWLKRFLRRNKIDVPVVLAGRSSRIVKIQQNKSTAATFSTLQENVYPGQFSDDPALSNCIADFENVTGCNSPDEIKCEQEFPIEEEKSMVNKLLLLIDESGVEMSSQEIRRFVFYYAWFYNLPNDFDKKTKLAGEEWYSQFTKRHPEIIPVSERNTEQRGACVSENRRSSKRASFDSSSPLVSKKRKQDCEFPLISTLTEDQNSFAYLDDNNEDIKPIIKAEPVDFALELEDDRECVEDQYSNSFPESELENPSCSDLTQNVTCVITEENSHIVLPVNKELAAPPSRGIRDSDVNVKEIFKNCTCDPESRNLTHSTFHPVIDLSHPIDSFFHSIAQMVKKLKPINQIKAKKATSNIVMELELEEACKATDT